MGLRKPKRRKSHYFLLLYSLYESSSLKFQWVCAAGNIAPRMTCANIVENYCGRETFKQKFLSFDFSIVSLFIKNVRNATKSLFLCFQSENTTIRNNYFLFSLDSMYCIELKSKAAFLLHCIQCVCIKKNLTFTCK